MDEEYLPERKPEGRNPLERMILKGVKDPSFHGEMFRLMLESPLFLIVPVTLLDTNALEKELKVTAEAMNWCVYSDDKGPFVPVFSSFELAMASLSRQERPVELAVIEMEAREMFSMLVGGGEPVRIIAPGGAMLMLQLNALAGLLAGEFTELRPTSGEKKLLMLHPIVTESLPPDFVKRIRKFCDQRRVPIGVYAFLADDPETDEIQPDLIHLMVWLRSEENSFYNDFSMMAVKSAPGYEVVTIGVTPGMTDLVEFLHGQSPVWPVLEPI
jgi:hypothetical protein